MLLVREAGGFVSAIEGGDAMFTQRNIVAGNETIHRELQVLLQAAGKG